MSAAKPIVYACEQVRAVQRLHQDLFTDAFRQLPIREQLDRQAQRIVHAHQAGNSAVVMHLTCWHPALVGHLAQAIMSRRITLEDARQTLAREYGFANWADVVRRGADPPDPTFEAAVDALLSGDAKRLRELLALRPSLVHERSRFGHRSTLLHYVGSNGVETHRQKVPLNLAELTQLLVEAGADVNATAAMYGGGSTTVGLLLTSCHPAEAGVRDEVLQVLLRAGAKAN